MNGKSTSVLTLNLPTLSPFRNEPKQPLGAGRKFVNPITFRTEQKQYLGAGPEFVYPITP